MLIIIIVIIIITKRKSTPFFTITTPDYTPGEGIN